MSTNIPPSAPNTSALATVTGRGKAIQSEHASYTVLRSNGDASWDELDNYDARSAEHAIRQSVDARHKAGEEPSGSYVAIPARSWKVLEIKTRVETVLKVEGL